MVNIELLAKQGQKADEYAQRVTTRKGPGDPVPGKDFLRLSDRDARRKTGLTTIEKVEPNVIIFRSPK
ncbi:hypothetical protein IPM62_01920 [Candidatus Woesebacteria bacterium]|nr:MAG: hypothetical protein IPM62_01920 [Candidatus Woesebacteria bacterium]